MYFNVVKREVKTNNYVKIVKSYLCYGESDLDMKYKAIQKAKFKNSFRWIFNEYYYMVEIDFE